MSAEMISAAAVCAGKSMSPAVPSTVATAVPAAMATAVTSTMAATAPGDRGARQRHHEDKNRNSQHAP